MLIDEVSQRPTVSGYGSVESIGVLGQGHFGDRRSFDETDMFLGMIEKSRPSQIAQFSTI